MGKAWTAGLYRPGGGSDARLAELVEGLHEISLPSHAEPGLDLLFEAVQPVTLAGGGAAGRPPSTLQTMSETLSDLGNGCLEPAPVPLWAHPDGLAADGAAVPGKPNSVGAPVKPARDEAMAPQPPAASGAHLPLGPLIAATKLN